MIERLAQIRTRADAFLAALTITAVVIVMATAMTAAATYGRPPIAFVQALGIAIEISAVIGAIFACWFVTSFRAMVRLNDTVERLARTDDLTGLDNRRAFLARAEAEASRPGRPDLSLLVLDIDYFKRVNDTYGHRVGDLVLVGVAEILLSAAAAGRLGGEEFAVLLPGCGLEAARQIAEELRGSIEAARIATPAGEIAATVSIGCAAIVIGDTVLAALQRADEALYAAKRSGRNCVAVCQHAPPEPLDALVSPDHGRDRRRRAAGSR